MNSDNYCTLFEALFGYLKVAVSRYLDRDTVYEPPDLKYIVQSIPIKATLRVVRPTFLFGVYFWNMTANAHTKPQKTNNNPTTKAPISLGATFLSPLNDALKLIEINTSKTAKQKINIVLSGLNT